MNQTEFERRIHYEPTTGCWLWSGDMTRDGYGRCLHDGREIGAHRVAYMNYKGLIPTGSEIDHTCHQRACVNPDHLRAVSHAENMANMRRRFGKHGKCCNGHVLEEVGTVSVGGYKKCAKCKDIQRRGGKVVALL